MADPYAAIRYLPFRRVDRDAGFVEQWSEAGVSYQALPAQTLYELATDLRSPDQLPFESKYTTAETLPDGTIAVTFQQPGAHKYDTMIGVYRPQGAITPAAQQYEGAAVYDVTAMLINDPMTMQTRQTSGARENWEDIGTAALVLGAVAGAGAYLGSVIAGGAGAGAAVGAGVGAEVGGGVGAGVGAGGGVGGGVGAGIGAGVGGSAAGIGIAAGPVASAGITTGTVGTIKAAASLVGQGLSLVSAYRQVQEIRDGSPSTAGNGAMQWVDDTGYLFTRTPDGVHAELPPVGVAFTLPDGRAIVNNGDGTFAIVDQLGHVVIRRYPPSAAVGGSVGETVGAGGVSGGLGDVLKRLSFSEWLGVASLVAMLAR